MPELKHVFDATEENFQQLVLENSNKGIVLVNYWTPSAGPCYRLWEELQILSREYDGRFLLVNVNTDTQKRLARESGVTSVPTVKIFRRGAVVESIHGAQSAQSIRTVIERHLPAAQHPVIAEAIRAYQNGSLDSALSILSDASEARPDDHSLHATVIKLMFREHRFADVADYYRELPESARKNGDIRQLAIHAELLRLAEQAPPIEDLDRHLLNNPDDLDALISRAALALVENDMEYALECLFHVFQRDQHHQEGFAHRALLSLFVLLGQEHELTRSFRQRMRDVLH